MAVRPIALGVLALGAAACATAPPPPPSAGAPDAAACTCPAKRAQAPGSEPERVVAGEAVVKARSPPSAQALAAGAQLPDLVILDVRPIFGDYYQVRFARAADGGRAPADVEYTRKVVSALTGVEGVLSTEPNTLKQARPAPDGAADLPKPHDH